MKTQLKPLMPMSVADFTKIQLAAKLAKAEKKLMLLNTLIGVLLIELDVREQLNALTT